MATDYDQLVSLSLWPRVRTFVDFYKERSAVHLLAGLARLDKESAVVSVRLFALDAEQGLNNERN